MSHTGFAGPLIVFGASPNTTGTALEYNPHRAPSTFDEGVALLDPRAPFTYVPGRPRAKFGWGMTSLIPVIDAVPSALAANNIAASQTPVAATALTLVSSSGAGITVSTSITNASTGATVTGLLAIDTAQTGLAFGDSGALTMWDPTKAIARNVRITSAGNDTGATFTVAGYDVYGYPMTETITGASGGVASGAKAFKYIASVTPAGTLSGSAVTVGTGDVFGLPIRSDRFNQVLIHWNSALITASTGYTAAVTTSPATATTGDVRGTYAVQSASDASKRLSVYVTPALANLATIVGLFGVTQA